MAITKDLNKNENDKFVESSNTAGQPAIAVVNPDGSNISGSGGTQYATNAAYADGNTGTLALVIRDDTLTTLTEADGDYSALRVSSTGALHVTGGGGGTEYTEDVATANPIVGTATLIERDDALSTVTPIEGDWIGLRGTAEGALWVQDFNSDAILADTANMDTNLGTIAGAVSGTEMQVDVVTSALPTGAATSANQSTIIGHVDGIEGLLTTIDADTGTLAGAVSGTEMQVDIVSAPTLTVDLGVNNDVTTELTTADLDTGAGTDTRAVIGLVGSASGGGQLIPGSATDGLLVNLGTNNDVTVTNATAANLKVDGSDVTQPVSAASLPLPTGAATSANQTTIIGHLDGVEGLLTTIDADTGNLATIETNTDFGTVVGGGTETGALRVTIANDSTGVVSIDDNGGAITVDGTVTANLSATDNAVLDAIEVDTTTIAGAVSGTEMQVDIVGALPAGTNAIGKLSANSGVDIGDVDVTSVTPGTAAGNLGKAEDAAHTSGDTGVMMLGVRDDSPDTAFSGTDGDYTPVATTSTGAVRIAPPSEDFAALANGPQVKKYYTNAGAVTDGIIWSPAAGKRWYVTDIFINVSAAATVTLEDDLAGGDSAVWKAELAANSGWSHSFKTPLFSGEDAADLIVTTSAGNVYITVTGYEI